MGRFNYLKPLVGEVVTIYSENKYQSYYLNYVTYEDMKKGRKTLFKVGVVAKIGCFHHEDCQWSIKFMSSIHTS